MQPGDLMHWILGKGLPSPDKTAYAATPFEGQVRLELIGGTGRNKRTIYLGVDENGNDWYSGPFPHQFLCIWHTHGEDDHAYLSHVRHVPGHLLAVYEQHKASVE
jgi:hypothetical protein